MLGETLGGFEKLILLAVLRLGGNAFGAALIDELEARTGRSVSQGAAYVTLRRLTNRGLLRAQSGPPRADRGGRPRRYYTVSPDGLRALREARDEWNALLDGIEGLLEEGT